MKLSIEDHDRDGAGLRYVYPVVSRRAGGVSIGVNVNPNNACNWSCVYCQVAGLVRGEAPEIDLSLLESELTAMLEDVTQGDFMERRVPDGSRRLNDVALSGNGESTTSPQFADIVAVVGRTMRAFDVARRIPLILITNGSRLHRPAARAGIALMSELAGEIWFKVDAGDPAGRELVNGVALARERVHANLRIALASGCRVRIQSCFVARDGAPPTEQFVATWLALLEEWKGLEPAISDVMIYGLARPSRQPEAECLSRLPAAWLDALAKRVRALGFDCTAHW